MTAVAFLGEFAQWLLVEKGREPDEADYSDMEIWELQKRFLQEMFNKKRAMRLLPMALDFVDYHYHYAAAIMAVPPPPSGEVDPMATLLVLPPSTHLARFSYDIIELLEMGEPDLPGFIEQCMPSGSWGAIYPCAGEVRTESMAEPYYRLLKGLDGTAPSGCLVASLGMEQGDAAEFLQFALSEGIVVPVQ
jgi:hypothetical protein